MHKFNIDLCPSNDVYASSMQCHKHHDLPYISDTKLMIYNQNNFCFYVGTSDTSAVPFMIRTILKRSHHLSMLHQFARNTDCFWDIISKLHDYNWIFP